MRFKYKCHDCGFETVTDDIIYLCPHCGSTEKEGEFRKGILSVIYEDYDLKALAAKDMDIPFYVAAPSSTIDWSIQDGKHSIEIENRNGDELRYVKGLDAKGQVTEVEIISPLTNVENPAFDVTPARLVTGIVTERGVCAPEFLTRLFPEGARRRTRW